MKIVISPAKSLNYDDNLHTNRATQPLFLEQAEKLNSKLSNTTKKDIQDLMSISEKLADLIINVIKNLIHHLQRKMPVRLFMLLTGMFTLDWMPIQYLRINWINYKIPLEY